MDSEIVIDDEKVLLERTEDGLKATVKTNGRSNNAVPIDELIELRDLFHTWGAQLGHLGRPDRMDEADAYFKCKKQIHGLIEQYSENDTTK